LLTKESDVDERTDREKRLDRFLNGLHPAMTDQQLDAFKILSDRITKMPGTILVRPGTTTPFSDNWLLREFKRNEWLKGMSQEEYNRLYMGEWDLSKLEQRQREVLFDKRPYEFSTGTRHAGRNEWYEWSEWYQWMKKSKERIMDDKKGLYRKFEVRSVRTGEYIPSAFVMLPEKDPAAVVALRQYALNIEPENPVLSADILHWIGTIVEKEKWKSPPIVDWAQDFFAKGMRTTTNGSGQDLVLIEAGPGRGKTRLGIIAGIKYWETTASRLWLSELSTGMGIIVTHDFCLARHLCDRLVNEFHGVVTSHQDNIVSIPTKIGHCTIRICAIDSPVLEGSHLHADWLFVDNIDLMRPQTKVWRIADRLDPKMLILSQSIHTFASSILANKNEWNVLTDPTLL
jgi:hypothetical protein